MSNRNWHINEIKADRAWKLMTDPATGEIDYGDIQIAHIDTGYTEHPVFGGEPSTNTVILSRLVNKHTRAIGKAIKHAVDDTGCSVISMSLGTPGIPFGAPAKNMGLAFDHAYDSGVITVAASGNNATDHVTYPAKYFRTICAAGINPDGTIYREHTESMREFIDIFAPASEIFRANSRLEDGRVVAGCYREGDGTSYATACTAAAAALWLAHRGDEILQKYDKLWMTIEAFRTIRVPLRRRSQKLVRA